MYFLIDYDREFVIGWSPKCACTAIKTWFLDVMGYEPKDNDEVHHNPFTRELTSFGDPEERWLQARNFKKFAIIRDPYRRAVSGYMDRVVKHKAHGEYGFEIPRWASTFKGFWANPREALSFDFWHFQPQTGGLFSMTTLSWWNFDLVIDMADISTRFHEISEAIGVDVPFGGYKKHFTSYDTDLKVNVSEWVPGQLRAKCPEYQWFYTPELEKAIRGIYTVDLAFARDVGIHYPNPMEVQECSRSLSPAITKTSVGPNTRPQTESRFTTRGAPTTPGRMPSTSPM